MGSADPKLLKFITRAAAAHGADPVALLATALQESGGRFGAVGDQGTSFGPYQFHIGGALPAQFNSHPFDYADSYDAVDNRARLFAQGGVHGGVGAAAVQRPADRASYATGVNSKKALAQQLLAQYRGGALGGRVSPPPNGGVVQTQGSAPDLAALQQQATSRQARLQSLLDANAQLAGIPSVSVPLRPIPQVQSPRLSAAGASAPTAGGVRVSGGGYPLGTPGKLIGTPYSGTHTLGNWESDNAVDLATPIGTPVVAMFDGTIGSQFGSLGSGGRFAGLRLHLQGQGNEAYYAHLSRFAAGVQPGVTVRKGQVIGYTGSANGVAHLHLGVRNGDPRDYL